MLMTCVWWVVGDGLCVLGDGEWVLRACVWWVIGDGGWVLGDSR